MVKVRGFQVSGKAAEEINPDVFLDSFKPSMKAKWQPRTLVSSSFELMAKLEKFQLKK